MDYKKESEKIQEFIKERVKDSKTNGVILGLSGGLDSSVVAVLAKKAIGNKLHCVYMPEEDKDHDFDLGHIEKLCERFDITFTNHSIGTIVDNIVDGFWEEITPLAKGNIKARIRMILLYAYANNNDLLVIGTGNKSELMVGYFTKHGDGAVDFEPLGHLYKTEVFELARHLDLPNEIVDKPPSAGLWNGQTDEKEMGISYKKLDEILIHLESFGWGTLCDSSPVDGTPYEPHIDLPEGITKEEVDKVKKMILSSGHKRRLPPTL